MRRAVAMPLIVLAVAGLVWFLSRQDAEETSPSAAPPGPKTETPPPRPRHREAPATEAPAPPEPVPPPRPDPAPETKPETERHLLLNGRTAAEIVAPFADVARRPGRERFRDDMVPGGAWTQLSDVVDEDFDSALAAFTNYALAATGRIGRTVDTETRRRYEECEKAYWRVTVDLQQRTAALSDKIRERAYRDDAERESWERTQARIAGVTDELNRARIREETEILKTESR